MKHASPAAAGNERDRGFYARRVGYPAHLFVRGCYLAVDILLLVPAILLAALSRLAPRPVDIGLGPLPTINSRYHKKCLERFGYRCETFVYYTWYFTEDFDVNIGRYCPRALGPYAAYVFCLFRYRCIYCYFNGGPLGFTTLLARCEPYLLQLAGIKTVVMPFGADVHVLTRTKNRLMVHAFSKDYPGFRLQRTRTEALVDVWTRGADHIVAGCDWVDFLYHWDTLTLSHFAVDTDMDAESNPAGPPGEPCIPLRLLHAPNHRHLKGTGQILKAVEQLRAEGVAIEIDVVEGLPNSEVLDRIRACDVVVDQLVLGWYAMFALEGMALGKPVVCSVRADFLDLYIGAGLLEPGELPLIDTSIASVKDTLRHLASRPRGELEEIGRRSQAFTKRRHSFEAVGGVFNSINRSLGILPRS